MMHMTKRSAVTLLMVLCCLLVYTSAFAKKNKSKPPEYPPRYEVPQLFIDELSKDDIDSAAISLLDAKQNPKTLFLLRETTKLIRFRNAGKPKGSSAIKKYLNAAIANHNLYLFLKANGLDDGIFYDDALKFYKKGCRGGSALHKDECRMLVASLYATNGKIKKSKRTFKKVDEDLLSGDFEALEYLAAYYSAAGNVDQTIEALQKAYNANPDRIITWLLIGDDFFTVQDDPRFKMFVEALFKNSKETMITLSVPMVDKAKLQIEDPTGIFNNKMPKYKKRRRR